MLLFLYQAKLEDTEVGLEELAKENQSLQVLKYHVELDPANSVLPCFAQLELEQMSGLTWVEDLTVTNCQDCQTKFTVRLRKGLLSSHVTTTLRNCLGSTTAGSAEVYSAKVVQPDSIHYQLSRNHREFATTVSPFCRHLERGKAKNKPFLLLLCVL